MDIYNLFWLSMNCSYKEPQVFKTKSHFDIIKLFYNYYNYNNLVTVKNNKMNLLLKLCPNLGKFIECIHL